jgi:hypothetical protein
MSNIKLEVGRTYVDRSGRRIKIYSRHNDTSDMLGFMGRQIDNAMVGSTYGCDGRFNLDGKEHIYNLIAEAPAENAPPSHEQARDRLVRDATRATELFTDDELEQHAAQQAQGEQRIGIKGLFVVGKTYRERGGNPMEIVSLVPPEEVERSGADQSHTYVLVKRPDEPDTITGNWRRLHDGKYHNASNPRADLMPGAIEDEQPQQSEQTKPGIQHAELIIKVAGGSSILRREKYKTDAKWAELVGKDAVMSLMLYHEHFEYRLKPEPVVRWLAVYRNGSEVGMTGDMMLRRSAEEFPGVERVLHIKLDPDTLEATVTTEKP